MKPRNQARLASELAELQRTYDVAEANSSWEVRRNGVERVEIIFRDDYPLHPPVINFYQGAIIYRNVQQQFEWLPGFRLVKLVQDIHQHLDRKLCDPFSKSRCLRSLTTRDHLHSITFNFEDGCEEAVNDRYQPVGLENN